MEHFTGSIKYETWLSQQNRIRNNIKGKENDYEYISDKSKLLLICIRFEINDYWEILRCA